LDRGDAERAYRVPGFCFEEEEERFLSIFSPAKEGLGDVRGMRKGGEEDKYVGGGGSFQRIRNRPGLALVAGKRRTCGQGQNPVRRAGTGRKDKLRAVGGKKGHLIAVR